MEPNKLGKITLILSILVAIIGVPLLYILFGLSAATLTSTSENYPYFIGLIFLILISYFIFGVTIYSSIRYLKNKPFKQRKKLGYFLAILGAILVVSFYYMGIAGLSILILGILFINGKKI